MNDDIVKDLRFIAQIHGGRARHACITNAANEIERLRALIADLAEYADHDLFCGGNSNSEIPGTDCPCGLFAILKAVNR